MNAATPYKKDRRDGLWHKCKACNEFVFKQTLERNLYTCPICNYYAPMPADVRFRHLLDVEALMDLYPPSIPKHLLKSLELTTLVARTVLPPPPGRLITAGEGTISGLPAVLAVIHPYAIPQSVHFVTLLAVIRTARLRKFPLITVYSNDALPKLRKSDKPIQSELSPAEIAYLTLEMDSLSEAHLPQITILTDANIDAAFSTRFPLGDLVLAEHSAAYRDGKAQNHPPGENEQSCGSSGYSQPDALIDCYVQRQDLPAMLGKLLAYFSRCQL